MEFYTHLFKDLSSMLAWSPTFWSLGSQMEMTGPISISSGPSDRSDSVISSSSLQFGIGDCGSGDCRRRDWSNGFREVQTKGKSANSSIESFEFL